MPEMTAAFVAEALKAAPLGLAPAAGFAGVSTDTRTIKPGELFVALSGPNFNGHDYVAKAFAAGAAGAVVARGFRPPATPDAFLLPVEDPQTALGELARAWRGLYSAVMLAITGSNGKTTVKEMAAAIMAQSHVVLKNPGNLNNLIGLPLTLLTLSQEHTAMVLEMGMNAPGEIARLTEIANPEVGLVGNVGPAHIGMLGSMENIAAAKAELYEGLSDQAVAVVNLDDPYLAPYAGRLNRRVLTFGSGQKANVRFRDISALGGRMAFTLDLAGGEPIRVQLATPGRHNVANAAAAAAGCLAAGASPAMIKAGLAAFQPVKGRLNVLATPVGPWIIDDTYNANPASVKAGLSALADVAGSRRKGLILGDMFELGVEAPRLHREVGQAAAAAGCQMVLALGGFAGDVAEGAILGGLKPQQALAFNDYERLMEAVAEFFGDGDVILVKGSRGMRMERVVKELTWQEDQA